jgi:hypothetical protein
MVTVPADDQIDETNTVALVKANFLYQFASNINWPEQNRKGKFTIGVYGNNTLFEEMAAKYGAKPVGNQVIEVVNLRDFNASRYVHILYVDKSKKADIQRIVKELKSESTLIVSSFDGGLTAGADINFRTVDSSIRYELNKSAMDAKKMTAGVKILQWAIK